MLPIPTPIPYSLHAHAQGDFSQLDEIESLAAAHDVVINAATSDDLDLTKAINRGLARGRKEAGKKGVLVHVSGTQLIESSGGSGNWEEVPKYDVSRGDGGEKETGRARASEHADPWLKR